MNLKKKIPESILPQGEELSDETLALATGGTAQLLLDLRYTTAH